MIGGLQGDFGDIDIKYLKQNISKCRSQISGSFKRKPRHCAKWLRNSSGKRYQQIQICLSEEVEMPSSPIRRLIRMWNIRRWWNVTRTEFRMWDIWRRWNVTRRSSACAWCRDPSKATPSGFPKRARGACDSFPIRRQAPDVKHPKKVARHPDRIPDVAMAKEFKASILHVSELSIALPWIPKDSPQSWIALVIKFVTPSTNDYFST